MTRRSADSRALGMFVLGCLLVLLSIPLLIVGLSVPGVVLFTVGGVLGMSGAGAS
jgi:hypothetical protein